VPPIADATAESAPRGRPSRAWDLCFRLNYRLIRLLDPLIRAWWRAFGLGNVIELVLPGRRSGRRRSVLLTLLVVEGLWYVGHPNGRVAWVANLEATTRADLRMRNESPVRIRAEPVSAGDEREAVVRATWSQQPFPGGLLYRLAREHVRARGRYFRLVRA
jgi:hypothetical protein